MHLHCLRGHFHPEIRAPGLGERRQQLGQPHRLLSGLCISTVMRPIKRRAIEIDQATHSLYMRAHGHQHAPHICMMNDRRHLALGHAGGLPLLALAGIFHRFLIGAFSNRQPLHPDIKARIVHHGEHAGHAFIFLTQQIADTIPIIAIGHDRRRACMNADLFFQRDALEIVALAECSILIDKIFRHDEQRDAFRARGSPRRTGQHQMNDILAHLMFAIGDENLLSGNTPASVLGRLRF